MTVKKAVAMMLHDSEGKILLMKRGKVARYESGRWELCGGAVEEGESFEEAAVREAREELGVGIQLEKILLHETYSDMGDGIVWEVMVVRGELMGEPKIQEPEKCSELRFVNQDELVGMYDELVTHLQEDLQKLGWVA